MCVLIALSNPPLLRLQTTPNCQRLHCIQAPNPNTVRKQAVCRLERGLAYKKQSNRPQAHINQALAAIKKEVHCCACSSPAVPGRRTMQPMLSLQDIRDAAERLQGQVLDTPCVESRTLSEIVGAQIFLKFENLQFTASFKERGACNKLTLLTPEERARAASLP